MSSRKSLVLFSLLLNPFLVAAGDQEDHRFTAVDEIEFTHESRVAFDRSGGLVTHHTLPGGVLMAEHNGSFGNITVARRGADGKMETFCATSEQAAKAWMAGLDTLESVTTLNIDEQEK